MDMICSTQILTPFTLTCQVSMMIKTLASYARGLGFNSQNKLVEKTSEETIIPNSGNYGIPRNGQNLML